LTFKGRLDVVSKVINADEFRCYGTYFGWLWVSK